MPAGGDVAGSLARLEKGTHRGDGLGEGRARRCYGVAVGMLEEEWAGEWVRGEASRWLVEAREELRKEAELQAGSRRARYPLTHAGSI